MRIASASENNRIGIWEIFLGKREWFFTSFTFILYFKQVFRLYVYLSVRDENILRKQPSRNLGILILRTRVVFHIVHMYSRFQINECFVVINIYWTRRLRLPFYSLSYLAL